MVIKMSKMAHFLYYMLMTARNQSQFVQNIYVHLKDLYEFFQNMLCLIDIGVTVRGISRVEISKKLLSQLKNNETQYFLGLTSCCTNGSSESNNP